MNSKASWDPGILESAFDEEAWVEISNVVSAAAGVSVYRKRVVECVASLPQHTVTRAVQYGFGGVCKQLLLESLTAYVRELGKCLDQLNVNIPDAENQPHAARARDCGTNIAKTDTCVDQTKVIGNDTLQRSVGKPRD